MQTEEESSLPSAIEAMPPAGPVAMPILRPPQVHDGRLFGVARRTSWWWRAAMEAFEVGVDPVEALVGIGLLLRFRPLPSRKFAKAITDWLWAAEPDITAVAPSVITRINTLRSRIDGFEASEHGRDLASGIVRERDVLESACTALGTVGLYHVVREDLTALDEIASCSDRLLGFIDELGNEPLGEHRADDIARGWWQPLLER